MDPSTDINQDPLTMNDNGATSFATDFDMSAINEAVAAGGEADKIQNSFDVNDIDLDNTPTTDAQLQSQLNENPDMSLAGGATDPVTEPAKPSEPAATFVDGDLADDNTVTETAEPASSTPDFSAFDTTSTNFEPVSEPVVEDTPAEESTEDLAEELVEEDASAEESESTTPAEPEEPATIADLANAANSESDPTVTPAPDPTPNVTTESEQATAITEAAKDKAKSKTPTYALIGLAIVAVVAVVIAVIVSLG